MTERHRALQNLNVQWSEAPLSVPGVYELFRHELPVFVKVKDGFYGLSPDETFTSEEELCISAVGHQQRVFCHDIQNHRHLSLPIDCEARVKLSSSTSGGSYTLKEAVDKFDFPIRVTVLPTRGENISVGGRNLTSGRAELTLLRCFDDPLLLAHNLYTDMQGGGINRRVTPVLLHTRINMVFSRASDMDGAMKIENRLSTALKGVDYLQLELFGYFVVYPGNKHPPMTIYGPDLEGSICEVFQRPAYFRQSNQYVSLADPRKRTKTLEELRQIFSSFPSPSSNPLVRSPIVQPRRPRVQRHQIQLGSTCDQDLKNELSNWIAKTMAVRKAREQTGEHVAKMAFNRGDSGFYEDTFPESDVCPSKFTVPAPFSAPVTYSKPRLLPVPLKTQVSAPFTLGVESNAQVRFDTDKVKVKPSSALKQYQLTERPMANGKVGYRVVSPFPTSKTDIPQENDKPGPTAACASSVACHVNNAKHKSHKSPPVQSRAVFNPSKLPTQTGARNPQRKQIPPVAPRTTRGPPPQSASRPGYNEPQASGTNASSSQLARDVPVGSFQSLTQVPMDLRGLGVKQVMDCLKLLSLTDYCKAFEKEQVDGEMLTEMLDETNGESMFIEVFGLKEFHARKLSRFVHGWRPRL